MSTSLLSARTEANSRSPEASSRSPGPKHPWGDPSPRRITPRGLLRWLYVGRITLVVGILSGALLVWRDADPGQTLVATLIFTLAVCLTGVSFWWSHVASRPTTPAFAYGQAILDVIVVAGVVHVTGGVDSPLMPLYILVIASGALLLPMSGGVLIAGLTCVLFVGEAALFHHGPPSMTVAFQVGLFGAVAVAVGLLADRLRQDGSALGRLESELRQLRVDTGEILNNIGTGVLTVDQEGCLAFINPVGERVLGLDGVQLRGQPVLPTLNSVAPGLGDVILRSMDEGRPLARFRTVTRPDLDRVTLGVSTTVLEREGPGASPVTAIFQDITDVERLEESNRRNERLRAIAALSASLAHEIKNPLASIQSAVEQLASDRLAAEDRGLLRELVVAQSQRLSRLLSEFIDFSALEMGPRCEFDLGALVREAMALVAQHPDARGVTYHGGGLDDPHIVPGDPDLVHRAVFNLLLNAGQFAGEGGDVSVTLTALRGGQRPAGLEVSNPVQLSVSDSGPGVDANDLSRIFDPFYTKRQGGSGLGLAVVHRTVEAHDGSIYVEDGPDGGARFVMILPGAMKR